MLSFLLALLLAHESPTPDMIPTSQSTDHYTYFQRGNTQDAKRQGQGGFVLMGGGQDVDEAFQWMAKRGGQGDFLVLRGSGADGYQDYLDDVTDVNSVQTLVIKDREAASDPFVLDRVAKAEMIFLAGGDQWNYVGKWSKTPLLQALNAQILKGVPIGGTSAGLAVLGDYLFSAQHDGIDPQDAVANPYHPRITLEHDFLKAAPLQGVITDSHFSQRDRLPRLATFMARVQEDQNLKTFKGIGVDEATAALVTPEGFGRVVGKNEVHLVSSTDKPEVCKPDTPLTFKSLKLTSLQAGNTFDAATWTSPERIAEPFQIQDGKLQLPAEPSPLR